jgi:Family of unknown function (DUF6335)
LLAVPVHADPSDQKRRRSAGRVRPRVAPVLPETLPGERDFAESDDERGAHLETSPRLTGGDVDADWLTAHSVGEEAVGGSVATPDQDIVDSLGEVLGVPQEPDAPVRTSGEILEQRDAHRWRIERDIARDEERGCG